jgi:hypothetical protein
MFWQSPHYLGLLKLISCIAFLSHKTESQILLPELKIFEKFKSHSLNEEWSLHEWRLTTGQFGRALL